MKQFLRVTRQGRWYRYPVVDWLDDNEIQGDALSDIQARDGRLSVYRVATNADKQRVAVALAATRKKFSNVDYAVFVDSDLDALGITVQPSKGDTPDEAVNELHYELGNLTVRRLARLAEIVSVGEHKRIWHKQIEALLQEAARSGQLDRMRIKSQDILESLSWKA